MENEGPSKNILVIDDDAGLLKLVKGVLVPKGYNVVTAQEAPAGLELAMKNRPDLIILDVMMPIINGFNICRLMKSQKEHESIPILLLTSRSGEEDRRIGQEVGANGYIAKPFKSEELLKTVEDLLKGTGP